MTVSPATSGNPRKALLLRVAALEAALVAIAERGRAGLDGLALADMAEDGLEGDASALETYVTQALKTGWGDGFEQARSDVASVRVGDCRGVALPFLVGIDATLERIAEARGKVDPFVKTVRDALAGTALPVVEPRIQGGPVSATPSEMSP
ncbi:hypothetical protein LAZ40_04920 [Cereibacter sphaeroides]|uniref:hypothetical protein n=1 Tax=Cereibacter sphaeroides TaxID=1063 RepID=UPI001F1FE9FF|nr:hypothetical protein [Cereibacter sphaeroides]MCE6958398.1 hypothetical protein [Cereibacter sphaeroides]MCE6972265.1 hypothetical protein [Cereibacter sphaeroides]